MANKPSDPAPERLLFGFADVAQMLDVPESWLKREVTARRIPFRRLGRTVRFSQQDIDAIVEASAFTPAAQPQGLFPPRRLGD